MFYLIGERETGVREKRLDKADDIEEARNLATEYANDPRDNFVTVYIWEADLQRFRGWASRVSGAPAPAGRKTVTRRRARVG